MQISPSRFGALAVTALLMSTAPAGAQEAGVDEFVQKQMSLRRIPGLSVAVVQDGRVVLARGYGVADVETAAPATAETVYQLASVTKQFTASAVMMLVADGKLSLDRKIGEILPGLPASWEAVTIHHLLTHTSGIPSYTGIPGFASTPERVYAHREIIDLVRGLPLEFAPGAGWNYSNTGYYLLGMAIEAASGEPYGDFVARRIFQPAGMSTAQLNPGVPVPGLARGHRARGGSIERSPSVSPTQPYAAGALLASVVDLSRWEAALSSGSLLDRETLGRMWTPVRLGSGEKGEYGYGWQIQSYRGQREIAHGGGIPGFNTYVTRFPEHGTSVIVLANQESAWSEMIARGVASHYIPALRENAPRPIADGDSATTRFLREVTEAIARGEGDPARFTDEARAFFFPDRIRQGPEIIGSDRPLTTFALMEESGGQTRVRSYRATFGDMPMRITFTLAADGRIAGIGVRPDESF